MIDANGERDFRRTRAGDRDRQLRLFLARTRRNKLDTVVRLALGDYSLMYIKYIYLMFKNVDEFLLCGPYVGI